jgi:hypothetical protein
MKARNKGSSLCVKGSPWMSIIGSLSIDSPGTLFIRCRTKDSIIGLTGLFFGARVERRYGSMVRAICAPKVGKNCPIRLVPAVVIASPAIAAGLVLKDWMVFVSPCSIVSSNTGSKILTISSGAKYKGLLLLFLR